MASDGEISCTNDPNFAVIYSFLKVFGKLYSLEVPTIAKLQELIENTQEVLEPLKELHLRLLRRALKSVQTNRWERCLIKFCHQQSYHQEAWELERFSYKKASTQVKLRILKLLLEYQFTCHPKFKNAVNAISCKELRLDPIGRDKNGCIYWLQVDHEANLCLYKEDQDEETWSLIASNRDELVKIIAQLKSGKEASASVISNNNEDSSSGDVPTQTEPNKPDAEDDNEEEFLSPESESEHDSDDQKESKIETTGDLEEVKHEVVNNTENVENDDNVKDMQANNKEGVKKEDSPDDEKNEKKSESETISENTHEVGESIEEPVMIVTGEGSGAECESSFIFGEEICEPVMYFYGEGWGAENDTGNHEATEQTHSNNKSDEEDSPEECNGENYDLSNSVKKAKVGKGVKLKKSVVNKRSLKKQPNDIMDNSKSDCKKHCIRDLDKSNGSNSNTVKDSKRESSINDKSTTDSEKTNKCKKKVRSKVKKKQLPRKVKKSVSKEALNTLSESENCQNSKVSIIEKRKSSLSSDQSDENSDHDKDKSSDKEVKEDDLPPKKLRLEPAAEKKPASDEEPAADEEHAADEEPVAEKEPGADEEPAADEELAADEEPSVDKEPAASEKLAADEEPAADDSESHSKETDSKEDATSNDNIENESNTNVQNAVTTRKKIKAKKGRFRARKFVRKPTSESDKNDKVSDQKPESKAVKRSLLDASDKTNESQSESEEDEPITSGKRLKIKPKKINTTTRKKVEAKHMAKSSSESEEETLSSIGKKTTKKILKKKPKGKDKDKTCDDDCTPVRQSRRIAQMKIKEEAERRHAEEVALRELKMIHKKKSTKDDEEDEWRASSRESSESEARPRRAKDEWREGHSSAPDLDSDPDSEPLFEHDEPDLDFTKSDHEFSPESDLEDGEPVEPVKRARTLQEGESEGSCVRCGLASQPEWILLCERCDAGYHASCLKPVLMLVPEGDWFCPVCSHDMLITALEMELEKYDELFVTVEEIRAKKKLEEPEQSSEPDKTSDKDEHQEDNSDSNSGSECSGSSGWSSASAVYRLRTRKHLPVSYRAQEYDRLISSAIKEEYVEPTTSAGNQGRGKDISTIIEAAEEEKMKAEREAIEQGKPVENKKTKKKQRKKTRKLNSLDVPSEDDDETDEDFKDTGSRSMESSSEDISSSAERESSSHSSDSLPVRRVRPDKKERINSESSPEIKKKKKGVFEDTSSESGEKKEKKKSSRKSHKSKKRLTQYDAEGNVIRARVTYGSPGERDNDWSPKHRTRQKKINYTEMPNTESEDEMHKSSGKHMPDSSDEFKVDSDASSDSDCDRDRTDQTDQTDQNDQSDERARERALCDLVNKTAVVPLTKLPDDVTSVKTDPDGEWSADSLRGRSGRGRGRGRGRGSRGRGRGGSTGGSTQTGDDALSKLVGVKIRELKPDGAAGPLRGNQSERDKKRQEREAKLAEKEARKQERIHKKEEKEKIKEQKAKEREEKRLAKIALQESKKNKKEKDFMPMYGMRPQEYNSPMQRHPEYQERFPPPRLQVRPELRGISSDERSLAHRPEIPHNVMREGTLSVAGSPQPFAPAPEEPSVITRMPHVINYRGQMMYPSGNPGYGPRGQPVPVYQMHPGLHSRQYSPYYPHLQGLPYRPGGPPASPQPRPPASPHHAPVPPGMQPHASGPPGMQPHSSGPPGMQAHASGPPGMQPHTSGPPGMPPHASGPPGMPPHSSGPPGMPPHASGPPGMPPHASGPLGMPPHASGPPGMSPHAPGPPGMPSHAAGPPGMPPHAPGPPGISPHGPPPALHGPQMRPPGLHGPPVSSPHMPGNSISRGPSPGLITGSNMRPYAPGPVPFRTPPPSTASSSPAPGHKTPDSDKEPPLKIKAEVKTEPEYASPPPSPAQRPSPEPPRNHPKIKHTENKDGRPRFPLGPYAPHYGPYGPYAPGTQANPPAQDGLLNLQTRIHHNPMQRMPTNVRQYMANDGKTGDAGTIPGAEERFSERPPGPHEVPRPGPPDRPLLHDMLRAPGSDRLGSHDLSRGPERSHMHDLSRQAMSNRPLMHDMARHPGPERHAVHDMTRPPGPERAMLHDMQRSPGPDRLLMHNMHRLPIPDRPLMHDMHRPPGPDRPLMHDMHRLAASDRLMHDIHRPPGPGRPSMHELPRPPGPDRPPMHDLPRPSMHDLPRPPGPDRPPMQVPPERLMGHEMTPHYPYVRARAPYVLGGRPETGSPAPPGESPPDRSSPPDVKVPPRGPHGSGRALVKLEADAREEGSVFGGLVSYFSSQREDDIDA